MADWIACPAGYHPYAGSQIDFAGKPFPGTDRPMTETERQGFACMNEYGAFLYQTGFDTEHNLGTLAFIGSGAALLFLPGWTKLLALPLAWFGLSKKVAGAGWGF
jgi:hypothetical protein